MRPIDNYLGSNSNMDIEVLMFRYYVAGVGSGMEFKLIRSAKNHQRCFSVIKENTTWMIWDVNVLDNPTIG